MVWIGQLLLFDMYLRIRNEIACSQKSILAGFCRPVLAVLICCDGIGESACDGVAVEVVVEE